ncbi:MAG: hypothetical protein GY924_19300, partial [Planctomycetaceae bacterium]|nr:hypothetical protein [Planctomycetaceae bacterium]
VIAGYFWIDAFDVVLGGGELRITKASMTVDDTDNGTDDGFAADVFSFDLTTLKLFAGTGGERDDKGTPEISDDDVDFSNGVGFYIDDLTARLAVVYDTASKDVYVGLEFALDEVGLMGVEGFSFVASADVIVNHANDSNGDKIDLLNWHVAGNTNDPDDLLADFSSLLTDDLEFVIGGYAWVNVFGVVVGGGQLRMTKATMTVDDTDNGIDDGFEAKIFSIYLSSLDLFVGNGASLDYSGDSPDLVIDDAVGFVVDNGNLNLVIAIDNLTDNVYTGLEISVDKVGLQGVDEFTFIASGKVLVNHASNKADSNLEVDSLNWHVAGTTNDADDLLADFDALLTDDLVFLFDGTVWLNAFGVVVGGANLELRKATVTIDDTDNGVDDGFEAEIFSIDLSTLDLFVGVGASLDSNTDPTDSVTDDAVGFVVDNGNLNLVIAIDNLTDNVYTGLEISVDKVGLQGVDEF